MCRTSAQNVPTATFEGAALLVGRGPIPLCSNRQDT